MTDHDLRTRLDTMERQLRRSRRLLALLTIAAVTLPLAAWRNAQPEVLRVRGLVVVDEQGRERIMLGAPVPDPVEGKRVAAGTGLVINDSAGVERFGLNLFPNGRVVMGFDAPPHTGDDRNRERISIVADEAGGGYLRLLDRTTKAKAFLRLGADNDAYLELLDWQGNTIRRRRMGPRGDTLVVEPR